MTKDEKIAKLGKVITDRATVLLGKDMITPDSPEYLGINSALKFTAVKYDQKMADDILDIALTMKKRVPLTIEQLAKKNPQFDRAYLEKAMQAISESGLVEFHWENLDGKNPNHEKRWVLDMFVPGSDYKARLEMLIAIQQKGDNRLLEQMKKPTVAYQKVIVSGNEKFYLNSDLDNWGIYVVYNPGEVAPMAAGIQKYYLPIDTISDIISYQLK